MKITAYFLFFLSVLGLLDLLTTSAGHIAMMETYGLNVERFGYISAILFELGYMTGSAALTGIMSGLGGLLHNGWFFMFIGGIVLLKKSKKEKHEG